MLKWVSNNINANSCCNPAAIVRGAVSLTVLLISSTALADFQPVFGPTDPRGSAPVELPLIDAPFNVPGAAFPSMSQSLWLATDAYTLAHRALAAHRNPWIAEEAGLGILFVAAFDFVTVAVPPFLAWQHEEWHRAVLSNRGITSFNDVYRFRIFDELIYVSQVDDEDLVRLKAQHPADQVRLSTAGIEGNYELAYNLERESFFADSPSFNGVLIPLLYLQNTFYMAACAGKRFEEKTNELNANEPEIAERDFTGADCLAWTYDLSRPEEPYDARGPHPSGVGIDRYRKPSDLDADERRYLRRQTWMSLLNFLDPMSFGLRGFRVGEDALFNLAIRHLPTSFGYVVRGDVFVKAATWQVLVSQQNYVNRDRYFPGLEISLIDVPVHVTPRHELALSFRVGGWLQPRRQRFDETSSDWGGLAGLRLSYALSPRLVPYVEVEAKTAGWVAGNVFLDRNVSARSGIRALLF